MNNIFLVEGIRYLVVAFVGIQAVSSFLTFLLGRFIIDYLKWGVFAEPENGFDRAQNFIMYAFDGFALYTFDEAENRYDRWIVKKAFHLVAFIAMTIVSVIFYYSIYATLKFIFY